MPTFVCVVVLRDSDAKKRLKVTADSEAAALERLEQKGYLVSSIEQLDSQDDEAPTREFAELNLPTFVGGGTRSDGPVPPVVPASHTHSGMDSIPAHVSDLIHPNERILYAARQSTAALMLSMLRAAVFGLIVGLPLYFVGALLTVPLFLVIAYMMWSRNFYVITNSRTIVATGIFNIGLKIVPNDNIQMMSINTGVIDRWLHLSSIVLSTAPQGGGLSIMALFPGMSSGSITLKHVVVKDVIRNYAKL